MMCATRGVVGHVEVEPRAVQRQQAGEAYTEARGEPGEEQRGAQGWLGRRAPERRRLRRTERRTDWANRRHVHVRDQGARPPFELAWWRRWGGSDFGCLI